MLSEEISNNVTEFIKSSPKKFLPLSLNLQTLCRERLGGRNTYHLKVMRRSIAMTLSFLLLLSACGSGNRGAGSADPIVTSEQAPQEPVTDDPSITTTSENPLAAIASTTLAPTTTSTLHSTTTSTTIATIGRTTSDRSEVPSDTPILFGMSTRNEPLTVTRHGDRDGARLLLIGSIHGDEDAGIAIIQELIDQPVPAGVELWLVPTINPDGNALQQRHNANGVDLNRNFPHQWAPLAEPGNWQYAGPSAASEPETAAMVMLGELVNPDLVLWYHQDLFRISPTGGRNGEIRALYAEISGLPLLQVTGGTYTGTASMWSRTVTTDDGTGFTVELGPSLSDEELEAHVSAVLAVAEQFYAS